MKLSIILFILLVYIHADTTVTYYTNDTIIKHDSISFDEFNDTIHNYTYDTIVYQPINEFEIKTDRYHQFIVLHFNNPDTISSYSFKYVKYFLSDYDTIIRSGINQRLYIEGNDAGGLYDTFYPLKLKINNTVHDSLQFILN